MIVVRPTGAAGDATLVGIVTAPPSIIVLPVIDFDEGKIIVREYCGWGSDVGGCGWACGTVADPSAE